MKLTASQTKELLLTLQTRFEKNKKRHSKIEWDLVRTKLESMPEKLWCLNEMERTGGEPDVIDLNNSSEEIVFVDCSAESPSGRRSLCYDKEALDSRKENKPAHSAMGMAIEMGIELLTEEEYRDLQKIGSFDAKTSSWVKTPEAIRIFGGALFCDFRYASVFVYHNGASSYYAARGFRASLRV